MDRYINDTLQKNEVQITQLENKLEAVISDNTKLCEVNSKLKGKVKELYEELRNKEDTLKFMKNSSENDDVLKKEIFEIRRENESLLQMKQELKLENNDLRFEVKLLKEKLCYNNNVLESKSSGNHSKLSSSFENSVMTNIPSVKKQRTKINYNQTNEETNMLKEENHKLSVELEDYKTKLYQKENELRILNDKFQTTELEKTRIKAKSDSDFECLVNELNLIKGNNDNLAEIHKFLEEIKEKNQTISHMIQEKTEMKNEMLVMKDNHELALKNYASEFDSVKENWNKVQDDFQKYRENMEYQLNELRRSFDDNIEETANLKKECEEYKKEKIDLSITLEDKISHYEKVIKESQSEFNQIFEERNGLVSEIKVITIQHCKDYEGLKEKLSKNKEKFEKIIRIYENHITFLQQRFKNHVNELLIALNHKSNNKEFNLERFLKNLDNVTSMINDISQVLIILNIERICYRKLQNRNQTTKEKYQELHK
jgi:cell division protein ZapA